MATDALSVQLCDYAAVHPDGLYTVLRGGAKSWQLPGFPINWEPHLFIRLPDSSKGLTTGQWTLSIVVRIGDANGPVLVTTETALHVQTTEPVKFFAFQLHILVPAPSAVYVEVSLGELKGSSVLDLKQIEIPKKQG